MPVTGQADQKLQWYEWLLLLLIMLIAFVLPLSVGGWMVVLGTHETYWSWTATAWPTTEGVITKSETSTSGGSRLRSSSGLHDAHIQYTYQVGGEVFTSDRFSFNTPSRSFASNAQAISNRYAVGSAVTVHYDPEEPSYATLETGVDWTRIILIPIGLAFLGFGVLVLRLLTRKRTAGKENEQPG